MDSRTKHPVLTASFVVLNMIWWMVMAAAVGVGAMHLQLCPVEPKIPVYLTVMGASSICSLLASYLSVGLKNSPVYRLSAAVTVLLKMFSLAWLIAGSYWVYSVYPPSYSGSDRYCHRITYTLAFAVTTLLWVAVGLCLTVCCCGSLFLGQDVFSRVYERFTYNTLNGSNEPGHVRT
ncbi:transmembrane protein 272-like [Oryzias latipes]